MEAKDTTEAMRLIGEAAQHWGDSLQEAMSAATESFNESIRSVSK